jgi:thiamine pyrophosphokinase
MKQQQLHNIKLRWLHTTLCRISNAICICTPCLLSAAVTRVCADGGANRLYDQLPAMLPHLDPTAARSSYLPDVIRGDMDSLRPDVHQFYSSHGVLMQDVSEDQDTTDMMKCVQYVQHRIQSLLSPNGSIAAAGAPSSSSSREGREQQQQQPQQGAAAPGAPAGSSEGSTGRQEDRGAKHRVLVLGEWCCCRPCSCGVAAASILCCARVCCPLHCMHFCPASCALCWHTCAPPQPSPARCG